MSYCQIVLEAGREVGKTHSEADIGRLCSVSGAGPSGFTTRELVRFSNKTSDRQLGVIVVIS